MQSTTIDLSWLCFVILFGIVIVAAVFGTRSRLRYARRIREAQARGAFADLDTAENKSRFRRLAALALIGLLGMISSIVIFLLLLANQAVTFSGAMVVVALLFGMVAAIAGFLIQKEINRRL
jgi:hypothetical protein